MCIRDRYNDGRYFDVIGKVSRLKNDFTVRNSLGTSLSGDYRNTGTSLSVEYGKRIKKDNGFYIDPNAELTLSRLSGVNFDARTNTGSTVHINSDAVNSVIGRIGVGIGKESKNSNLFLKTALAHEFSGKMKATYRMTGEPTTGSEVNLKEDVYKRQSLFLLAKVSHLLRPFIRRVLTVLLLWGLLKASAV